LATGLRNEINFDSTATTFWFQQNTLSLPDPS